ncbi:hypothetical protein [Sphingomonas bacterium]|uniref:hypothetical protein n=1 Tax=Sphingomonas bacterium TaxID=1895847 RepID=UPI001575BBD4|nr:hypothetical protein [Sphingomonas bacterium]
MNRTTLALGTAAALLAGGTADAQSDRRTTISPYIELSQVLDADLKGGDVVTYSEVAVGIDAATNTPRVQAQISYRYERRIGEGHDIGDADVNTGLARIDAKVAPGLSLDAGGLATRSRNDIRGAAPGILTGNVDNISQVYTVYGGPSYRGHAGAVALSADYGIGYTKVTTPTTGTGTPGQRLDYYDHSLGQTASVGASVAPGAMLPVGVSVGAGYQREDGAQLDQRFEGYHARGDVLAPVAATVALTAGVGYEKIDVSQKDALLTAAGVPVQDGDGRFVTDPTSPRRVAYRTDGVYYDAGVVWHPNHRTSVEAHVGRRYGSTSYTGTATYQASKSVGLAVNVYDTVETFGQQLRQGVANLPTSFVDSRDQFGQQFNGCVFGTSGAAPGGCLNSAFQSISTASFRARGVDAVLSAKRGLSTYGFAAGYTNRELYAPNVPSGIVVYGEEDQSYYGQLFYGRALSRVSGINANAFLNYYTSDLPGSAGTISYGATAAYYHYFGRLGTTASLGVYNAKTEGQPSDPSLQALLGARYQF